MLCSPLQLQSTPFRGPASSLTLVLLSNWCGISQSTLLLGSASSLAHRPVSDSHTICNRPSLPRVDIVLFRFSPQSFKTCLLGRGFHTLIKNDLFHSPTNVRSHKPPLLGTTSSLALVPLSNQYVPLSNQYVPLSNQCGIS